MNTLFRISIFPIYYGLLADRTEWLLISTGSPFRMRLLRGMKSCLHMVDSEVIHHICELLAYELLPIIGNNRFRCTKSIKIKVFPQIFGGRVSLLYTRFPLEVAEPYWPLLFLYKCQNAQQIFSLACSD